MTWGEVPPPCPGCGSQVVVGIMSLRATCTCGWWWRDETPRGWNKPEGLDDETAYALKMRERRIRLHAVASYIDARVYQKIHGYSSDLKSHIRNVQRMVDHMESLLRDLREVMREAREEGESDGQSTRSDA